MPMRPSFCRVAFAALPLAGLLFLSLFAAPRLPAGEPSQQPKVWSGAERPLVRVTYSVADLVIPVPSVVSISDRPAGAAAPNSTQEDRLIRTVMNAIEPASWVGRGGHGTIDYQPLTMTLVVCQTAAIQGKIADLLAGLRREQDTEVALEVRLVSVDESFLDRLDLGATTDVDVPGTPSDAPKKVTFLSDKQLSRLLVAVQGDARANIMQTPKMTLFDKQTAVLDVTHPEEFVTGVDIRSCANGNAIFTPHVEKMPVGLRLVMKPAVTADRRFARVEMKVDLTTLDEPKADLIPVELPAVMPPGQAGDSPKSMTQLIQHPRISRLAVDTTCSIPDGGTALISGLTRERTVRTESGPPVLSDIPYVNRLFKNVSIGREKQCVLLLVTPRIVVATEEEEKVTGKTEQAAPARGVSVPLIVEEEDEIVGNAQEIPAGNVEQCAAPVCRKRGQADELVAKYNQACAEGRTAEAVRLAVQALAIDPTCFRADTPPQAVPRTSSPRR